jgi:ribokinase
MATKPITILGTFMADLVCRAERMPVWGETLRGNAFAVGPGGKGSNQAIAAARQGARVNLVTRLGRDPFGDMARNLYRTEGIGTEYISEDPQRPTGTASIIVDDTSGENAIVIVPGACDGITEAQVDAAGTAIAASSLFVTQLELPLSICRHGIALARRHGIPVLLNPAPAAELPRQLFREIDYITPNETEASALVGRPVKSERDIEAAAACLHDWGVSNVLITLGERGVYVSTADYEGVIPAYRAGAPVETTGAGDAFNGGLATALAEGRSLQEAARFGTAVAGLSVTRAGAANSMPTRAEVDTLMHSVASAGTAGSL